MRRRITAACLMGAVTLGTAAVTLAVVRPAERADVISSALGGDMFATDPDLPLLPPLFALQTRNIARPAGVHMSVPILVYHYIRTVTNPKDPVGWGLSVPPAIFKAQMDWLREVGGHTVTLEQLMAALHGGPALPSRSVVLTFDDGHSDFATRAVPVLLADGFVATVFVNTGFLHRPSYMTAAQVQQASAEGMVIGDHTVNHVDLNGLPASAVKSEIAVDRAALENLIGKTVLDFAYPYGDYNGSVVSIVAAAGFRDAVTMQVGQTEWFSQPLVMPRIRVGGGDTVWSFASKAGIPSPPRNWVDPTL